jgi:hypothetical protein
MLQFIVLSVDNYLCKFWEPTYEDCLNLIARLSQEASVTFHP